MDILAGISILYPHSFLFGLLFYFYLALFHFFKGGWSILASLAGNFYFDILGIIDVVTGIAMFALYSEIDFAFFWIIGVIILLKGLWSFLFSFA